MENGEDMITIEIAQWHLYLLLASSMFFFAATFGLLVINEKLIKMQSKINSLNRDIMDDIVKVLSNER